MQLQSNNNDMGKTSISVMISLSLRVAGVVQARREVSELVSSMVEAGGALPLPEDRLLTIMEAAQVLIQFLLLSCSLLQVSPSKQVQ